jgi:hypothetical protein
LGWNVKGVTVAETFVPGARFSKPAPLNEVVKEKLGTMSLLLPAV